MATTTAAEVFPAKRRKEESQRENQSLSLYGSWSVADGGTGVEKRERLPLTMERRYGNCN